MKELGMVLGGCFIFFHFFSNVVYPNLEYKGYSAVQNCTGECYEEYVREHGTVVEQLIAKREEAQQDPLVQLEDFGQVVRHVMVKKDKALQLFQKLAGQSAEYITGRLYSYKNNETVGP